MQFARVVALCIAIAPACLVDAALVPSSDGRTVHDTALHVTWLANANLAGAPAARFGVQNITPSGAMSYQAALAWIEALNAQSYLGHNNWQLPATPAVDPTCGAVGPNGNSFGADCSGSALGSLYYTSLGLKFPNTAVPIPAIATGPFTNFQPYLYWTGTAAADAKIGYHTFSFNTGWHGANVNGHFMYVLPVIKGRLPGSPAPNGNALQPSADGQTVYDPIADVTWLADANLASTQQFGAQCTNHDGTLCITADGSMTQTTAETWINDMNAAGWLGQRNWQLPPQPATDSTCTPPNSNFDCTGDPMGSLYYKQLKLAQGTPAVATPNVRTGPFSNLQPYLYWSCSAAPGSNVLCDPAAVPAPNFGWSFSFGNGFEGTDLQVNDLYVMIYYPDPPQEPRTRAVRHW